MRVLIVLLAAFALAAASASVGVDRAQGTVLTTTCAKRTVAATATQWAVAQKAFANAFARIRTYVLNPTIANQQRMFARVDTNLFEDYSYQAGILNQRGGKVSGGFTWTFVAASRCFDRSTSIVSFRARVHAQFKSTNHHSLTQTVLADVQLKPPRIIFFQRVPGT